MPGFSLKRKTKEEKEAAKAEKEKLRNFSEYPYLLAIKPKEKYVFHSDYFEIDGQVATIMHFFHMDGAADGYPAFWGIGRIPSGMDSDVTTICFEQVRRMTKGWVESHSSTAESVAAMNAQESNKGTNSLKQRNSKKSKELEEIAHEIADNSAYLEAKFKIMVKAPTIEKLDRATVAIARRYVEVFSSLDASPYMGQQRQELANLFMKNDRTPGHSFDSTCPAKPW